MSNNRGYCMSFEVGVVISIATIIISYLGYQLSKQKVQAIRNKEVRDDASREAVIETKLDAIGNGVDNIRIDLRANERNTALLTERVTRNEESTKQAHKRLDELQGVKK